MSQKSVELECDEYMRLFVSNEDELRMAWRNEQM